MGTAKTEKQLKEETRARRAKHELKNTPLPIKRRSSIHDPRDKKLFESRKWSESNSLALTRLANKRVATSLDHSKSMTDLSKLETNRDCLGRYSSSCGNLLKYIEGGGRYKATCQNLIDKYRTDDMKNVSGSSSGYNSLDLNPSRYLTTSNSNITRSSLGRYSKSCSNLVDGDWTVTPRDRDWTLTPSSCMTRSKSYARITDVPSSYDQINQNYRTTVRNMYTNIKDFSSRTVAALSSHRTSGSVLGSTSSRRGGSEYSTRSKEWSTTPTRFLSTTPSSSNDTSSLGQSKKSLRQLQMTNNLMSANTAATSTGSSLSSYIGSSCKQFSSSFNSSSTTSGSKSRFASMKAMFA